jgi:imidazolonepropionase-like amidohydrolase
MLAKHAYHVPTLSAYHQVVSTGTDAGIPAESVTKALAAHEMNLESFRKSLGAGVPIAAGTDAGTPHNPHGGLSLELELMVQAGATPQQAIRAATIDAASALELQDEIGQVGIGKLADLVLVEGDPLEDITCLARPVMVIKRGRVAFSRDAETPDSSSSHVRVGVS